MTEKKIAGNQTIRNEFEQKSDLPIEQKYLFDQEYVLNKLRHYLPSQAPLKDFIHHNSLHAFQEMKFYDAIFKASGIFGYQVTLELSDYRKLYETGRINPKVLDKIILDRKGKSDPELWKNKLFKTAYDEDKSIRIGQLRANWLSKYHVDLDDLVQPILFRILVGYLDQGISLWSFPGSKDGFLNRIRELEKNSYTSLFKTSRARKLLSDDSCEIKTLLDIVVGREELYYQYLFDQQFSHRGWSGMVATLEQRPETLLDPKIISLNDLIILELLLEIDALDSALGTNWPALGEKVKHEPVDLFTDVHATELAEIYKIWQDAFEWSYYDDVLTGLKLTVGKQPEPESKTSFQALFCIDERECSLRRHFEQADSACATFGTPGFFGAEFFFQPENGKFYDKLCPAPVTPKYLIKETHTRTARPHDLLYTGHPHSLFTGTVSAFLFGAWTALRLPLNLFKPKMSPAISNAFALADKESTLSIENKNPEDKENGLQIGFTLEEMTIRVEGVLKSIGLVSDFANVIYAIGHGSSSANNPHHGAHDCGACSGRPGSVNARVFAFMANHKEVRKALSLKGIQIPEESQFIGALHDTAADEIEYYDTAVLTETNLTHHQKNLAKIEKALDLNAKERSRRFASISTRAKTSKVRKAVKERSVSLFEPRPELGHGTNSLCIVGDRELTKKLFLDRRAFLNSYDYKTDPEGKLLSGVMKPLGPVCGGINLEYYFSRVDNHKLGAGTKLPHNVMGLIGVSNSCDGDLRPGLPLQMIEVHDPVRLLVIVEHFPDVVLNTIKSVPEMYEWYINEWVHLIAIHPDSGQFYYFSEGAFSIYEPIQNSIEKITDFSSMIETAKEMETNYIVDATKENLPVQIID